MDKKILEVCLSPDLGGLELFVANCSEYFSSKSKTYVVISKNSKLDTYIKDNKFYIKRNRLFPILPALKLARLIDKYDISTIHFHWTKDIVVVILAKLFSQKKPKIVQSRHMHMTRFKNDFYHKWLYKNIDTIHAVTKKVQEKLEKYIPYDVRPAIKTIYLGVKIPSIDIKLDTLKERYKIKEKDFLVGIIGRIEEAKGQEIVIDAIGKLKDLDVKLLIVGHTMDKKYLSKLKQRVKDLNIEEKVFFCGFTQNVNKYFKLCDVTILATKNETFGLTIIESMACKTPVIATNRDGPLEIIDDGVDSILFDRSSEDLANKIKLLYYDRDLLKKLKEKALDKVLAKFQYEKQLDKIYEVL